MEIALIINKIIGNALILILEDSHIAALTQIIHVKMVHILHLAAPLFLNTEILGNHHPDVKILPVKILGQGTYNVRQSSCLNKRHRLRSHE